MREHCSWLICTSIFTTFILMIDLHDRKVCWNAKYNLYPARIRASIISCFVVFVFKVLPRCLNCFRCSETGFAVQKLSVLLIDLFMNLEHIFSFPSVYSFRVYHLLKDHQAAITIIKNLATNIFRCDRPGSRLSLEYSSTCSHPELHCSADSLPPPVYTLLSLTDPIKS